MTKQSYALIALIIAGLNALTAGSLRWLIVLYWLTVAFYWGSKK